MFLFLNCKHILKPTTLFKNAILLPTTVHKVTKCGSINSDPQTQQVCFNAIHVFEPVTDHQSLITDLISYQ